MVTLLSPTLIPGSFSLSSSSPSVRSALLLFTHTPLPLPPTSTILHAQANKEKKRKNPHRQNITSQHYVQAKRRNLRSPRARVSTGTTKHLPSWLMTHLFLQLTCPVSFPLVFAMPRLKRSWLRSCVWYFSLWAESLPISLNLCHF